MRQLATQVVAFSIIGLFVYVAARLLGCRPGKPTFPDPRKSSLHALASVCASMALLFLMILAQYLRHGPTPASEPKIETPLDLLPQLVVLAVYFGPACLLMALNRESLRSVRVTTRNLWQSVIIGLGLAFLTFYFQPGGFTAKIASVDSVLLFALVFYAFVGFGEEFLFRGYLQTRLVSWLGTPGGWLVASVIMALVHWPHRLLIEGQGPLEALMASVSLIPVSLLMGFIMLRTGNLVAPALFHTFANWVNKLG